MPTKGKAVIRRRQKTAEAKAAFDATFSSYRDTLSYLVAQYFDANKQIVRTKLRLGAMDKKTKLGSIQRDLEWEWLEVLEDKKRKLNRAMLAEARKMSDWKWMRRYPGLGPVTAVALLSKIDVGRLDTPSKFWKVTLGSIVDNRVSPPVEGHRYFPKVKQALCFYTGQLGLLRRPQWRAVYDAAKEKYRLAKPDWTKGHVHNAARRKMVEQWCIGLWQRWRRERGFRDSAGQPQSCDETHALHRRCPAETGSGAGSPNRTMKHNAETGSARPPEIPKEVAA